MNEHVGFLTCPRCQMPWDSEQLACACGETTKPAALRCDPLVSWICAILAVVGVFAFLIDRNFGGHGWKLIQSWLGHH